MKKTMKKIVAMICVAAMVFGIAYVPKEVKAATATASSLDKYQFAGVNNMKESSNGVYSQGSGNYNRRLAQNGTFTTMDGTTFDALINFSSGSGFTIGNYAINQNFRITPAADGGSLRIFFREKVGDSQADVTVTAAALTAAGIKGFEDGFFGKDMRVTISMLILNTHEDGTIDIQATVKLGSSYTKTLTAYNATATAFSDAGGIIIGCCGGITFKAVKEDTDYRTVSVADFTKQKEFVAFENNTKMATDVPTFDNVLLDGIYNFGGVGPNVNIGSGTFGLQINLVKYHATGVYYMRYQLLDGSLAPAERCKYYQDVPVTELGFTGADVVGSDLRIRVGFTYANVITTDGVTIGDVTVYIKMGDSYENIFTVDEYRISDNLIIRDEVTVEVEGEEQTQLVERENVLIAFNNTATGTITVKSGPSDDLVVVTPADFGCADNHDQYVTRYTKLDSLTDATTNALFSTMDNKVLSVNVHFDGSDGTLWQNTYVGIQKDRDRGLSFGKKDENTFFIKDNGNTNNGIIRYIDAQKAGLSSASEAFNLKISIEYVDVNFDGDDLVDDIKYGVYINDRLCLETYAPGSTLLSRFLVNYASETTTLQVSSPVPEVSDSRTPHILEDYGVEEQVYNVESMGADGSYFQDIGAVSEGGSSVTGKVSLSGDAALTLYGNGALDNYGLTVLPVKNLTGSDTYQWTANTNLNFSGITNFAGYMVEGVYSMPSTANYMTIGHPNAAGSVRISIVNYNNTPDYYLRWQVMGSTGLTNSDNQSMSGNYCIDIPAGTLGFNGADILGKDIPIRVGFSIENEVDITYYVNIPGKYEKIVTLYKANSGDVWRPRITVGASTTLPIGMKTYNPVVFTDQGVRFEMTDSGLVFNSNIDGLSSPISIPFTDVTDGEEFDFTVQEEIFDLDGDGAKDDVRLSVWVNGQMANNKRYYMTNVAGKFSKSVYITPGTKETSNVTVKASLTPEVPENLDDTENGYIISGQGVLTVNNESKVNGDVITKSGEYIIRSAKKGAYIKQVVLYRTGNVHMDEEEDVVDALDLVALKKAANGATLTSESAKAGADVDGNNTVDAADCTGLRNYLVGKGFPRCIAYVAHEEDVMPIVGFYGPYRAEDTQKGKSYDFITEEIYQLVSEVGINQISYTSNADYRTNPQEVLDSLRLAEKYGIGLYVNDTRFDGTLDAASYANYLKDYAKYRSFKGFFVVDEPSTSDCLSNYQVGRDVSRYADKMSLVNSYSNTMAYMNMYPKKVVGTEDSDTKYSNYINSCLEPGMKYISWDYYTFDNAAKITEYFEHLSIMRDESIKRSLPFWGFIQAGRRWNDSAQDLYPEVNNTPTESQMFWNLNTTLAYGAKGIQYFPLMQPFTFAYENSEDGYDYDRNGLIAANGEKTKWYNYAKNVNKQIATVDEYLLYATTLDVLAVGSTAQANTGISKTTYGNLLTGITAQAGALVGVFDYQGRTAFYVVNYDTTRNGADTITLTFSTNQEWDKPIAAEGQLSTAVTQTSGKSLSLSLNNGGAALVILK